MATAKLKPIEERDPYAAMVLDAFDQQEQQANLRTWDDGKRCAECCNGDRCDDPTHLDRRHCPHCKGTGWALWTEEGRNDYVAYLCSRGATEQEARAVVSKLIDGAV